MSTILKNIIGVLLILILFVFFIWSCYGFLRQLKYDSIHDAAVLRVRELYSE